MMHTFAIRTVCEHGQTSGAEIEHGEADETVRDERLAHFRIGSLLFRLLLVIRWYGTSVLRSVASGRASSRRGANTKMTSANSARVGKKSRFRASGLGLLSGRSPNSSRTPCLPTSLEVERWTWEQGRIAESCVRKLYKAGRQSGSAHFNKALPKCVFYCSFGHAPNGSPACIILPLF